MAYQLVTDRDESQSVYSLLCAEFARDAIHFHDHPLGWPSGSGNFLALWHEDARLWAVLEPRPPIAEHRPRFWFSFGVERPTGKAMLSITVEVNPPHNGVDRRVGGAFLKDEAGRYYVGHSGRVGGGRPGVGQQAFLAFCKREALYIPERRGPMFMFGPLDGAGWIDALSEYVHEVQRFKEHVRK